MRVAFRTDASNLIGTGHFMRCLTLADSLNQSNARVRFICRHLPPYFQEMLEKRGYEYKLLESHVEDECLDELAHSHWLGVSQAQDAKDSLKALSDVKWDWLIVDHYGLDTIWESKSRIATAKIMVIDDIADRQHNCDVLLDQNYYLDARTRYIGKIPEHCQLLLGPRYALLRSEFRELRKKIKPRRGAVKRILVFFGGIDIDNYTERAVEALATINIPSLCVDVVIGAKHPALEEIKSGCEKHGFSLHVQTDQMAELMSKADLALGAGGITIWERCCMGLPTMVICTAPNQVEQVRHAAQAGLLIAPEVDDIEKKYFQRHLLALIENENLRILISQTSLNLMDEFTTERVTVVLKSQNIVIRKAIVEDMGNLFLWRNHSTIREVSRNNGTIAWEAHQQWFSSMLTATNKALVIGCFNENPIGVVRFDINDADAEAEISIYLVPENKQAEGLGKVLLQKAEDWLALNFPDIKFIRAEVLGKNKRSEKMFIQLQYRLESIYFTKRLK